MKTSLLVSTILFFGSTLYSSCNKDTSDNKHESRFTWTYDGKTYTAKQDTAYTAGIGAPSIIAGLNTALFDRGSGPRINLNGLTVGSYTFGSGSGNSFLFIDDSGNNISGISGTLNITGNANNLLSGNFNVTLYK